MNENEKVYFDSDDDWSDIDFSDLEDVPDKEEAGDENAATETEETTEATTEANPAEEVTTDGADNPPPAPEPEADQLFELKVLGEERKLTRDEMIAAAQKGLDYDRVKNRNAELQKEREANAPALELMHELAEAQGISVEELITNVRAAALAKKEGISLKEATSRVQLKTREDAIAKREAVFKEQDAAAKNEAAEKEARNKEFVEFFQNHPGVKPDDIPKQCFVDMKNGMKLEASYANQMNLKKVEEYNKLSAEKEAKLKAMEEELAELKKQLNSENQNQKNAARSVGSAETAGKSTKDDAFDALWNDGT